MQHVVAHVRSFLRFCYERRHLRSRLDEGIDTLKTYRGERPPRALPWRTVQALLASIDRASKSGWRDYCVLHLIAHCGPRPSEVVSLRLNSVDWERYILHVTQHKPPPPRRSSRCTLSAAPARQGKQAPLLSDLACDGALVAGPDAGSPIDRPESGRCIPVHQRAWPADDAVGVRYLHRKHVSAAARSVTTLREKRIHPHSVRHSTAVALLKAGVDFATISQWLGHASLIRRCVTPVPIST